MAPRSGGAKSGGALPKLRILCPKTAFFGQKQPQNPVIAAKLRQTVPTLHVRHDCPVKQGPFFPSSSTICPRNGPKMAKNGLNMRYLCPTRPKITKNGPYLGLRGSKSPFRGHLVHPQPPTFCGLQPSESPNETPRPPNQWSLGGAGGQPGPRTVGANGGSTRVPGAKKIIFSKVVRKPPGMLKQVFLAHFEPVVTCFGPWKIPKWLENGPFQDQGIHVARWAKWLKMGSIWAHFTCLCTPNAPGSILEKRVFDPFLTHFWSQNGPFSRHFGTLGGPKGAAPGSKRAETTCFGTPRGPRSFLEKVIFWPPVEPSDPFWHPRVCARACTVRQPSGPRYGGLGILLGSFEGWEPQ